MIRIGQGCYGRGMEALELGMGEEETWKKILRDHALVALRFGCHRRICDCARVPDGGYVRWGSGVFEYRPGGWDCVASDWDSSG